MKKVIAVALLVLTVASLCACKKVCKEHTFEGPTCEKPKTCTTCGATEGNALKHNWMPANCEEPRHCVRCELVDETAPLHNWLDATCDKPKRCARCEVPEGEALGHKWVDGTCSVCGLTDETVEMPEPTLSEQ